MKRQGFRSLLLSFCFCLFCVGDLLAWDFAEHRKIGDRAMILMPDYLVRLGLYPSESSAISALCYFMNMSLSPDSLTFEMRELSQKPNMVTYGTLCGLAGDHVENPIALEIGLQTHFSKTNRTLALENEAMEQFQTGASSKELLSINLAYGLLAIKDLSHFYAYGEDLNAHLRRIDPDLIKGLMKPVDVSRVFSKLDRLPSMSKYFCLHIFAVHLAQLAGWEMRQGNESNGKDLMYYATLYEAFAEHFLQDSFASGHQMVRRGFSASAVSNNKSLHDFYNTIPVQTANLKGETWSAFGDRRLNQVMEIEDDVDYTTLRATAPNPYKLPKGDPYERETKVFYQVVNATCVSIGEVWRAYHFSFEGDDTLVLEQLPEDKREMPEFIYKHFPVVREFPLPFGTNLDKVPLAEEAQDRKEELQLIVQEPFTRNFIRSRVANSFMIQVSGSVKDELEDATMLGARLNVSMLNWHRFGDGKSMTMRRGSVAQWLTPTISGAYRFPVENIPAAWHVKAGANYDLDIFVSPKRFFALFSYLEMGLDHRDGQNRFLIEPAVGIQIGSLIGLHNFNMPGWLRIPLSFILPLKMSVSCQKVAGLPVDWIQSFAVDILF